MLACYNCGDDAEMRHYIIVHALGGTFFFCCAACFLNWVEEYFWPEVAYTKNDPRT